MIAFLCDLTPCIALKSQLKHFQTKTICLHIQYKVSYESVTCFHTGFLFGFFFYYKVRDGIFSETSDDFEKISVSEGKLYLIYVSSRKKSARAECSPMSGMVVLAVIMCISVSQRRHRHCQSLANTRLQRYFKHNYT
jgi:hypothetical protein